MSVHLGMMCVIVYRVLLSFALLFVFVLLRRYCVIISVDMGIFSSAEPMFTLNRPLSADTYRDTPTPYFLPNHLTYHTTVRSCSLLNDYMNLGTPHSDPSPRHISQFAPPDPTIELICNDWKTRYGRDVRDGDDEPDDDGFDGK